MDIGQTLNAAVALPPAPSTPVAASAQINSDFEMFLKMLTAQMQYQDPLNPVDSTDYATQLATFSGVEQAVLTNDLLKSLTGQMTMGGLTDMAGWVGKDVRAIAPAYFDGQPISLAPQPSVIADRAELVVRNEAGAEVQRIALPPASDTYEWTGIDTGGFPLARGLYSFEVVSFSNDVVIAQDKLAVYSKVTEVRLENDLPVVILQGGASVPADQVTALRAPS